MLLLFPFLGQRTVLALRFIPQNGMLLFSSLVSDLGVSELGPSPDSHIVAS
jgi:hypothetical protein